MVKNESVVMFKTNLPCFSLYPLPLVLSLGHSVMGYKDKGLGYVIWGGAERPGTI